MLSNFGEESVDLVILRDIAWIKRNVAAELAHEFFDIFFKSLALVVEDQLGPCPMPRLRKGPGDATLVRDAKDDAGLPGEDAFTHSSSKGHPQLNCHAEKNRTPSGATMSSRAGCFARFPVLLLLFATLFRMIRPRVKTTADYIASGFVKIDADLDYLMECLKEVLVELGETKAAQFLPWQHGGETHDIDEPPPRIEQAYSIAFQLLNMVEENASTRTRHLREIEHGLADEPGLWGQQLTQLKAAGFSAEEILTILPEVRVESVLTAHPTEAKRAAVLEQHRAIFLLLSSLEDERLTPSRREAIRDEIKIVLERLWRSGEILLEKPEIASERRGVIFYMREVFPRALEELDERLLRAWKSADFDPALLENPRVWPRLRFGSWVGGDRDGHPFVTAKVTEETLGEMRLNAMIVIHRHLEKLAEKLPLSSNFQSPPESLEKAIARLRAENPDSESIVRQHSDEPWRQYVMLLQAKLPLASAGTDDPSTVGRLHALLPQPPRAR